MNARLSFIEKRTLIRLAGEAIECAVNRYPVDPLALESLPPGLRQPGVCFVTLHRDGRLRGCVGGLEARMPLAEDAREHATMAALCDFRFAPVRPDEVTGLAIEISVLSPHRPLEYRDPAELLFGLRPGVDGVTLSFEDRRATFLPQVWDKVPDVGQFLDRLCEKMGHTPGAWRRVRMNVFTYEVDSFSLDCLPDLADSTSPDRPGDSEPSPGPGDPVDPLAPAH